MNWKFLSETGIYPFKNFTGQRIPLLLNSFSVLIHETLKILQKLRLKIKNCKKLL